MKTTMTTRNNFFSSRANRRGDPISGRGCARLFNKVVFTVVYVVSQNIFQTLDFHFVSPGEDPAANAEQNRAVAEHEQERRDEKREREEQQKRLG